MSRRSCARVLLSASAVSACAPLPSQCVPIAVYFTSDYSEVQWGNSAGRWGARFCPGILSLRQSSSGAFSQ